MDLIFEKHGDSVVTVKYRGKLNIETASEYEKTVKNYIIDENIGGLILDFGETDYISSIGIRVILELNRYMSPPKSFAVTNLSDQVSEALKLTGMLNYLNIV